MSFLDSVLSSIGTGSSTPKPPPPKVVPLKRSESSTDVSLKRKAEDELVRGSDKSSKIERKTTPNPVATPTRQPPKQNGVPPIPPANPPSAAASNKNPKKGSFAAIMARAKEAQASPSIMGTITHKPKEKTRSRKELLMEREELKKASKKGIPLKSNKDSAGRDESKKVAPGQKASASSKPGLQGTVKPSEKPGYQGTVRPSTNSSYTGTSKPGYSGTARPRDSSTAKQAPTRRRVEYDESDDYGSEDQDDYESDDLSDMDAGFDDMEEEEEYAARLARKEDAAEQAELERLKREKERKKALLAKGRR